MTEIQKLIKAGKELNLNGEELRIWAENKLQEQNDREERNYELMQTERENERRKIEEERLLIEQKRLMTEREIELVNLRRDTVDSESNASSFSPEQFNHKMLPRLPVFQESVDHITVYLDRFEKYVTINKFPKDTHAMVLSTYLKGSALEVFHRLSIEESQNYEKLKEALLKRYEVTAEQSRKRFREISRNKNETFHQLKVRLEGDLFNWIEMSGGSKTNPDDLIDIILKEQFMANCSKELQTYIMDREPGNCADMATLADRYVEARKSTSNSAPRANIVHDQQKAIVRHKGNHQGGFKDRTKTCSYCKRSGHSFDRCFQRQRDNGK